MSGIRLSEVLQHQPLRAKNHSACLRSETGWGEPVEYWASCSCGWESHKYVQASSGILVKKLQDFIAKWGIEQYEAISRTSFKEDASDEAIRQLLHHLDYDVEEELAKLGEKMKEDFSAFQNNVGSQTPQAVASKGELPKEVVDEFHNLQELTFHYKRILAMKSLIKDENDKVALVVNMKAFQEYKKLMETLGGQ